MKPHGKASGHLVLLALVGSLVAWTILVAGASGEVPTEATGDAPGELDLAGAVSIGDPFGACHADSYAVMAELGVKTNRKDIAWAAIEPTDDVWSWDRWDARVAALAARNMTALPILDYANLAVQRDATHGNRIASARDVAEFVEYSETCVARYYANGSPPVTAWEIWNEPNLGKLNASEGFWTGTDAEFFRLQAETARALRARFPNLTICSGGISGHDPDYLARMFEAGAMADVDVLAFHPYSGSAYDSLGVKIDEVAAVCRRHHFPGELWITEVGMSTQFDPTAEGYATAYREALERQASVVPKVYAIALARGIKKVVWYCLEDFYRASSGGDDWRWGEANFGLVFAGANTHKPAPYANDTLKPAGYAYKALAHHLNGSTYVPRGIRRAGTPSAAQLQAYYFLQANGDVVLICWNARANALPVEFEIPGAVRDMVAYAPPSYKRADSHDAASLVEADGVTRVQVTLDFAPLVLVVESAQPNLGAVTLRVPFGFLDFSLWVGIPVVVGLACLAYIARGRGNTTPPEPGGTRCSSP